MRVIYGGDEAFNALLFGVKSQTNSDFFRRKVEEVSQYAGDFGQRFYEQTKAIYDRVNSSEAIAIARAAVNQVRGIFREDVIQEYRSIDDIQIAGRQMQRYIMANPLTRERYHQQRCDGYSDTYVDRDPGVRGAEHYDYRRVMDGAITVGENGWESKTYAEELRPGDDGELPVFDRHSIQWTWDTLEAAMNEAGRDPTSPWNSSL